MDINNITGMAFEKYHLRLSDFLKDARYFSRLQYESQIEEDKQPENEEFQIGYQTADEICLTRNSTERLDEIRLYDMIELGDSLFKIGAQLNVKLRVIIHYPGQLLRAFDKPALEIGLESFRKPPPIKALKVMVTQVTTLRKRPDSNTRCNPNIKNDDIKFQQKVIKQAGCVPIYWHYLETDRDTRKFCTSPEEVEKVAYFADNYKTVQATYDPPCVEMNGVAMIERWFTKKFDAQKKHFIQIKYVESTYQEIQNVREFSFETFFAGIGGFVGIFLGYSILQIPDLLGNARLVLQQFKYPVVMS